MRIDNKADMMKILTYLDQRQAKLSLIQQYYLKGFRRRLRCQGRLTARQDETLQDIYNRVRSLEIQNA